MLGRVGARRQLAFQHVLRQSHAVGHHTAEGVYAGVQVVLDLIEIAVVGVGDLGRNVALRDPVYVLCRHVQRSDHCIEGLIHALDDLAEVALMLGRIGTGGQFAFHRSLGECIRVLDQRPEALHQFNHCRYQLVVLRPAASLLVLRQVAKISLRDFLDSSAHMQNPIHCGVGRFRDVREDSRVRSLDTLGVIVDSHPLEHSVRFHEAAQPGDAGIQVVLDLIEIAVVGVGNLGWDVALRDAVHVFGRNVQRLNHVVQRQVEAFDHLAEGALVFGRIGTGGQFAIRRRLHQQVDIIRHVLQRRSHVIHGLFHLLVVAAVRLRDQFVDLACADLRQDAVALADWQQDRIEHRVHALDQLAVVAFELVYLPALAEAACARGFHQPEYLLQQIVRLRCYWTVQNGGAGGRVSAGRNSPAVVCLFCHGLCSFVFLLRYLRCVTGARFSIRYCLPTAGWLPAAILCDSRSLWLQCSISGAPCPK